MRVRDPFSSKQVEEVKEKWLILDQFERSLPKPVSICRQDVFMGDRTVVMIVSYYVYLVMSQTWCYSALCDLLMPIKAVEICGEYHIHNISIHEEYL